MKFESAAGPYTLELALEQARNGRPGMLIWFVEDKMGVDVAAALADLLRHPEKLQSAPRAMFLPNEADAIRWLYKHKRKLNPKTLAPIIQDRMAKSLCISTGLLLDIIRRKNTYTEEKGSAHKRTPTRKRKK
jgi:hypothetical protein